MNINDVMKTPTRNSLSPRKSLSPMSPIPLIISPLKNGTLSYSCLPSTCFDIILEVLLLEDPETFFRSVPLVSKGWLRAVQSPMLFSDCKLNLEFLNESFTAAHAVENVTNNGRRRPRSHPKRSTPARVLHFLKRRDLLHHVRDVQLPSRRQPVDQELELLGTYAKQLERLSLTEATATDDGIRVLAEGCKNLKTLVLASSKPGVTNFGLMHVAANCRQLRQFNGRGLVGINSSAVRWLLEAVGQSMDQFLLNWCPFVGGVVTSYIAQFAPRLRVLQLQGVCLTRDQFSQLVYNSDSINNNNNGSDTDQSQHHQYQRKKRLLSPLMAAGTLECLAIDGHEAVNGDDLVQLLRAQPRLQHCQFGKSLSLNGDALTVVASSLPALNMLKFRPSPDVPAPLVLDVVSKLMKRPNFRLVIRDRNGGPSSVHYGFKHCLSLDCEHS